MSWCLIEVLIERSIFFTQYYCALQDPHPAQSLLIVVYSSSRGKVQVYQVRSLDRPLFIVFVQNSEGIIATSQTREQGMMECAVSSSLLSLYASKKRVH